MITAPDYCDLNMEDNLALSCLNVYSIYSGPDEVPTSGRNLKFTDKQWKQISKEYLRVHYYLLYRTSSEDEKDDTLSLTEKRIRRMIRHSRQSYYGVIKSLAGQEYSARPLYHKIVETFEENLNIEFEYPSKNISEPKSKDPHKMHEIAPKIMR